METDDAQQQIQAAIAGELRLVDPAVRASDELVTSLLDPEFSEFGASGRRWDRKTILEVTRSAAVHPAHPVRITRMTGTLLAPGLVHLTYHSDNQGRRVNRSSLWRHHPQAGWRLYFHQGTLSDS
ncbi:nuclear transport factor 2 family protein [Streptomyces kunmingensis]|uniref:Nuclear transport factor 2 family protein n=1 Tax=Streptomyces kunmingensis TaxID=68225 RepID=A0ABU6C4J9_9ACTN|nr:nuclear transport factor 2 family protein [Streptomyces kunmingensis]MEB3959547.1 nuclear transport factor 2 family protein [Streptomyces kunmingensis]